MLTRRNLLGAAAGAALSASDLAAALKPGKKAPELVITLNTGELVLLSKFVGKVVVLEFLLTTCPHCQTCSSVMQKLYAEMGPNAFQPLGTAINPDNQQQARMLIPEYIYKLGLRFPVGWTQRDMAYNWLEADVTKGPVYFPQLVMIDRKGIIRGHYPGGDEFFKDEEANMRKMITSLVKETGAAHPAAKK